MKRVLTMAAAAVSVAAVALSGAGAVAASGGAAAAGGAGLGAPNMVVPTRWVAHRATGTETSSANWAGYAQTAPAGTFTGVEATFVVTTVNTHVAGEQFSADWVGISGFNYSKRSNLVQAGVEEDNLGGTAYYGAWTEILPHAEVPLSGLVIHAGDRITVTVRETANVKDKQKRWAMTVADDTTRASGSRVVKYTSHEDSAEAIHERPVVGSLSTLATTTNETFDPAYYTTSAPNVAAVYHPLLTPVAGGTLYDIDMLANNGTTVIATPSNADSSHIGFTVADGSTTPAAPSP